MAWNDGLARNSAAYEIAASVSQRLRVIAGPGTGKSFAMKRRVAKLLEEGVDPDNILPVTFTRVAAEDLHRELVSLNVTRCQDLEGRTLHSLGLKILSRRNVLESTGRVARPLNQFEIEPLVHDLPNNYGGKREKKKKLKAFEAAWARLQSEEPGYALNPADAAFEIDLENWLRFHRGMLIGEIIPKLYQYLKDNPAARELTEFRHLLVDEFQDLNKAEQAVIHHLGSSGAICIVGDDDQSIYSFKHAHPDGIREWNTIYAAVEDKSLLDCRRCPTLVVKMANSLISYNRNRESRQLSEIATNGSGSIQILQYSSLDQEIAGVCTQVLRMISAGVPPGDILILAQRGVIGTPIFHKLREHEIPVKSYYEETELDSESAQERLAILKLLINPDDRIALRWLLGFGSNDFRTKSYTRIRIHSEQTGLTPWQIMIGLAEKTIRIPHTSSLVKRFKEISAELENLREIESINDLIEAWLSEELTELELLHDLVSRKAEEASSAEDLLEAIVTEITQPEIPPDVTDVRIMSLHKSKGLSSPVVIIAGCIDGLLPKEPDEDLTLAERTAYIEEQRRLFYVGITRVKASPVDNKPGTLILTYSGKMSLQEAMSSGIRPASVSYGTAYVNASRFIRELGPSSPAPEVG